LPQRWTGWRTFIISPCKEDKVAILEFAVKTLLANQGYKGKLQIYLYKIQNIIKITNIMLIINITNIIKMSTITRIFKISKISRISEYPNCAHSLSHVDRPTTTHPFSVHKDK